MSRSFPKAKGKKTHPRIPRAAPFNPLYSRRVFYVVVSRRIFFPPRSLELSLSRRINGIILQTKIMKIYLKIFYTHIRKSM